jgi:hypothetical protein
MNSKEGKMKFKSAGGVILCVLALASLAVLAQVKPSDPAAPKKPESVEPQKIEVPGLGIDVLRISPGIDPKWKGLISLGERVEKDIAALEKHFSTGKNFAEMDGLLRARHAVVAGVNYEMMFGGTTAKFWSSIYTPGATLKIKVVSAFASNVPGPHFKLPLSPGVTPRIAAGKKLYDAVAFVAMEIHVISKPKPGDPMHNDTYFMDLGYRHQWCCVWGDEEVCLPPI